MPKIMSYFFYDSSCRRLLAILTDSIKAAKTHREEHAQRNEPEDDNESRKIESLLQAAKSVDEECKKLQYWSDVRDLAKTGRTVIAEDELPGLDHELKGLDTSGPPDDNTSSTPTTAIEDEDEGQDFDLEKEFDNGLFSLQPEENDEEDENNITLSEPSIGRTQEIEQSEAQDQNMEGSLDAPNEDEGNLSEEELNEVEPVPDTSEQESSTGQL
jgi:hypothetical protein